MDDANVFEAMLEEWNFTRKLSRDLLADIDPAHLDHTPTGRLGPLWKQFRHLGRLDECYLRGLETGTFDFEFSGRSGQIVPDKSALSDYLNATGRDLTERLKQADPGERIIWSGTPITVATYMTRILGHETFHHGELVVYVSSLKRGFPESWAAWGV